MQEKITIFYKLVISKTCGEIFGEKFSCGPIKVVKSEHTLDKKLADKLHDPVTKKFKNLEVICSFVNNI